MSRTVWILAIFFVCLSCGANAQTAHPKGQKPAAPAKKKTARERALPAGAVQIAPDTWELKQPGGATVRYRRTPFGFMQEHEPIEGAGGARTTASPLGMVPVSGLGIKAVEDGERIRFEKVGPGGVLRWTRKKTELSEPERQAWEQAKAAKAKAAAASAPRKEAK